MPRVVEPAFDSGLALGTRPCSLDRANGFCRINSKGNRFPTITRDSVPFSREDHIVEQLANPVEPAAGRILGHELERPLVGHRPEHLGRRLPHIVAVVLRGVDDHVGHPRLT